MSTVIEEKKHEKYGGSTMERLEICSDSNNAIAALGERPSSPAAERGTRIHERVEAMLTPTSGWDKAPKLADDEEAISVETAKTVFHIMESHGFTREEIESEQKVLLKSIHESCGGKFDHGGVRPFDSLVIVDVKAGHKQVMAENNLQLAFYALGKLESLDEFTRGTIDRVVMYIVQPEKDFPYVVHTRKWEISVGELEDVWYGRIYVAINRAETHPTRTPGEHCQNLFCDAKAQCPAYQNWLNEQSSGLFFAAIENEKVNQPKNPGDIAKLLKLRPLFEGLFKQAEEDAKMILFRDPQGVPGYALRDAYGNRSWKNEKDVEKTAKELGWKLDEYKPRELLSPAKFEKLAKSKKIEVDTNSMTEKLSKGSSLVKSDNTPEGVGDKFLSAGFAELM